jgi:transposase-like protein
MTLLPPLAIRILQKCAEQTVSKTAVTQYYKKHTKEEREEAVRLLLEEQYIIAQVMPRPDTRKAPTFYVISDKGRKWLKEYYKMYPAQ